MFKNPRRKIALSLLVNSFRAFKNLATVNMKSQTCGIKLNCYTKKQRTGSEILTTLRPRVANPPADPRGAITSFLWRCCGERLGALQPGPRSLSHRYCHFPSEPGHSLWGTAPSDNCQGSLAVPIFTLQSRGATYASPCLITEYTFAFKPHF